MQYSFNKAHKRANEILAKAGMALAITIAVAACQPSTNHQQVNSRNLEDQYQIASALKDGNFATKGDEISKYVLQLSISSPKGNYTCTGALLTPNVVLTAAHCFEVVPEGSKVTVILRDGIPQKKSISTTTTSATRHPLYLRSDESAYLALKQDERRKRQRYDVAALRLPENFGADAAIAELDFEGKYLAAGQSVELTGYGTYEVLDGKSSSGLLRSTLGKIIAVTFGDLILAVIDPKSAAIYSPLAGGDSGGPVFAFSETKQRSLVALNMSTQYVGATTEDANYSEHVTLKGVAPWLQALIKCDVETPTAWPCLKTSTPYSN